MRTDPPRWSRLDPDARRAEIVAAARRLFTTRPFASVSITAIADEAGVSRALVTHYFGGKRELFLAVLQQFGELGSIVPRTNTGLPIEETVARNVEAWLDFMEANQEIAFAIASLTSVDRDPAVAAVVDDMRDAIVDRMLLNHFGATDVPPHVRFVLRAFTGFAQVAVSDWLSGKRATREQVSVLMARGLLTIVREVLPAVAEAE